MSNFQKTVMIDCAAIGHYVKFALRRLQSGGDDTGVIFGFLGVIKELSERMSPGQFVFAWDSRKSKRRQSYPDYKRNRRPDKLTEAEVLENEVMRAQLDILRTRIIPELGFKNSFLSVGLEADDIIASCCLSLSGKKIIVSRDNDLFQLLNRDTRMWDFQKKKYFTADDFAEKWGIEPHQWKTVKTIAGCSGDGVPNVPGVKELTAIKYLKNELPENYKTYKAIKDGSDIIERNKPLVILPFKNTPKYRIQKDNISVDAFWNICEEFEFNSFLADIDEWVEDLRMK